MRISINVTNFSWETDLADELDAVVRAADEVGLDTVWVGDHLLQVDPNSSPEAAMLEAYTTLGYLAARTSRVRLGTMVTGVTYRPAALLIKAVTTLDVLSRGRAWLGIGAGYSEVEARAMGLPLPAAGERFARLGETLELARRMWVGDDSAFVGRHLSLERPVGNPLPVGRVPVLIGGMGEGKTLRLVARYADACNLFDIPDGGATLRRKLGVLGEHCDEVGRDVSEIEKTVSTRLNAGESAEGFLERVRGLGELGIGHVVVIRGEPWSVGAVETLGEVLAAW
ncbi:TIGR03560 family F420-dependent LLM class oxidoreductase [Actinokineospora enzanensis]|uniref:TIGR03560 family F420-dependent LLM class oxidoreductase n=1 Tax=Actinokineospora enzanensis TaxID=155975 RepID=UPI000376E5DF|nr:TIGR03560 family F420-dependent LLM class oxidoreductase [Actinokineospora enzanensis]